MSAITIYHNPRCSTSRNTLKLLEENGITPVVVDYLKNPLSADDLRRILALMGKGPRDVLRPKEAKDAGIDPAQLSDDALTDAIAAHPQMLQRPIVVAGNKAALGRPPEAVLDILPR